MEQLPPGSPPEEGTPRPPCTGEEGSVQEQPGVEPRIILVLPYTKPERPESASEDHEADHLGEDTGASKSSLAWSPE